MSIFASRVEKVIAIPFDVPQTVTIRRLAGRHLERAQLESQVTAASAVQRMGGPAFQRELLTVAGPKVESASTAAPPDPLNLYDHYVLLDKGICAWSYDEPIDSAHIEDLTEEVVEFLAREILKLSKPALFRSKEEQEADRKNG